MISHRFSAFVLLLPGEALVSAMNVNCSAIILSTYHFRVVALVSVLYSIVSNIFASKP